MLSRSFTEIQPAFLPFRPNIVLELKKSNLLMILRERDINPFELTSGSLKLTNPSMLIGLMIGLVCTALILITMEIKGIVLFVAAIAVIAILARLFSKPKFGIYLLIAAGFFVTGAARYVEAPWGLAIDGILVLIYIALFFKGFSESIPFYKAKSWLTLLAVIWMGYIILELGNPEVVSYEAWFYAMRGVGFYQVLAIPLFFMLFDKSKDLHRFFVLWGILSFLGTAKGLMQYLFGVDPFEQRWLDLGGAETHVLFGKLRIFSFYSDAGQFGASQGHAGVVFGILAGFKKMNLKWRVFFLTVSLAGFVGMIISGTRGALGVPALGALMFLILRKNLKLLIPGIVFLALVYVFFAFTTIGNGNAEIRRMRTAFDPNNASLQVRLSNQNKLKGYLADKPMGGGLGATGNWGQRFTPHTLLANTATDSWYVMIWADTGIIGLYYHLGMLFLVIIVGTYLIYYRIRNDGLKIQMIALLSGIVGIMMASYGNGVFGQMPTGILMYGSMTFLFLAPRIDKELTTQNLKLNK